MYPKLKLKGLNINGKDICLPGNSEYNFFYIASMGFFLIEREHYNGEITHVKIHLPLSKNDLKLSGFLGKCNLQLLNVLSIEYADIDIKTNAPPVSQISNIYIKFDDPNVEEYHLFSMSIDNELFETTSLAVTSPVEKIDTQSKKRNKKKPINRILQDELCKTYECNISEKNEDDMLENNNDNFPGIFDLYDQSILDFLSDEVTANELNNLDETYIWDLTERE